MHAPQISDRLVVSIMCKIVIWYVLRLLTANDTYIWMLLRLFVAILFIVEVERLQTLLVFIRQLRRAKRTRHSRPLLRVWKWARYNKITTRCLIVVESYSNATYAKIFFEFSMKTACMHKF